MSNDHDITGWAESRSTSIEVASAIWGLAKKEDKDPQTVWEEPTQSEILSVWRRIDQQAPQEEHWWGEETLRNLLVGGGKP